MKILQALLILMAFLALSYSQICGLGAPEKCISCTEVDGSVCDKCQDPYQIDIIKNICNQVFEVEGVIEDKEEQPGNKEEQPGDNINPIEEEQPGDNLNPLYPEQPLEEEEEEEPVEEDPEYYPLPVEEEQPGKQEQPGEEEQNGEKDQLGETEKEAIEEKNDTNDENLEQQEQNQNNKISNCLKVTKDNKCETCKKGFKLNSDKTKCELDGCQEIKKGTSDKCSQCKDTFTLNQLTEICISNNEGTTNSFVQKFFKYIFLAYLSLCL